MGLHFLSTNVSELNTKHQAYRYCKSKIYWFQPDQNMTNSKKKGSKNLTEAFQTLKQISNRNKLNPDKISAVFPALPSTQK